jgi:mono/diheme cytochrome c family protein
LLVVAVLLFVAGCRQDMHNQPRYKPFAASQFFDDGRSARPMIEGTVARGHMRLDPARFTGKVGGLDVIEFPFPITRADIERGEQRFNIYCSPCHGRTGDGQGMIVKRGFRSAANYHTDRLRRAPVGHFFDVVTNGFGAMPSYASRVPVDDRWRIIAYVRALQYSQAASINEVPPELRDAMDKAGATGVLPNGQPPGEGTNPAQPRAAEEKK